MFYSFKKILLKFYQKFEKIYKNFEEIWKIYKGFCEKFYGQNFSTISLYAVLYTAERDVCVIVIFKKSGGARAPPGPSDATPMFRTLKTLMEKLTILVTY